MTHVPPNQPYQRLARTEHYKGWKPLAELVTFAVFTAVGMAMALAPFIVLEVPMDGLVGLLAMCLSLAVFIPTAFAAASIFRPMRSLSSVALRFRWPWFLRCLVITFPIFGGLGVIWLLLTDEPIHLTSAAAFLTFLLPTLVVVPLQAAGEELAFRGVLLQALGAWFRKPLVPIVLSSILFSVVHVPETWGLAAVLAASGAMFAIVTIRTGGLEAAIAMHATNNVFSFTMIALEGKLDTVVSKLNLGVQTIELIVGILVDVVVFAALLYLGKRHRIENLSPPRIERTPSSIEPA